MIFVFILNYAVKLSLIFQLNLFNWSSTKCLKCFKLILRVQLNYKKWNRFQPNVNDTFKLKRGRDTCCSKTLSSSFFCSRRASSSCNRASRSWASAFERSDLNVVPLASCFFLFSIFLAIISSSTVKLLKNVLEMLYFTYNVCRQYLHTPRVYRSIFSVARSLSNRHLVFFFEINWKKKVRNSLGQNYILKLFVAIVCSLFC